MNGNLIHIYRRDGNSFHIYRRDGNLIHIKAFDLPGQEKKIVVSTEGIVVLGEVIARRYLQKK